MSFKDEIRAVMPYDSKNIENSISEIKGALRLKAMTWHSDVPFSVTLYLPFGLNSEYLNQSTVFEERKGFFKATKVPQYTVYSLTEKAYIFQKQLSEKLLPDGIKVADWKLVEEIGERGYGARGDFREICSLSGSGEFRIQTRIRSVTGRGVTSQFQELYLLPQNIRLQYPCIALELFFSEEE